MSASFPKPRIAVSLAFITNGIATGTFISRIPDYKHFLHVSTFAFGFSLFCASIGVLLGLGPGGRLSARFGSSRVIIPTSFFLAFTIFLISITRNYLEFTIALFIFGAATSSQDVSMNAHALTLEHKDDKKYMSVFHGIWSSGTLISSILGGLASQLHLKVYFHALIATFICVVITIAIKDWLLPPESDIHSNQKVKRKRKPKIFWILGLLAICGQIGEGATGDWGSILARDTYHVAPFISTLPYILFSCTMVLGRISGDRLRHKFPDRKLVIFGSAIAGSGMIGAMLFGNIASEIIGWFIAGAGLSILIPIFFVQTGEIARRDYSDVMAPSEGVAMVSGVAYAGFMAGPPIIGFFASVIGLRWALLIPGLLALFLSYGSSKVLK